MITIVLGAQWGDEGKGKLVDILCVSQINPTKAVQANMHDSHLRNCAQEHKEVYVVSASRSAIGGADGRLE